VAVAVVVASTTVGATGASAEPVAASKATPSVPGDGHASRDKDNRAGRANPTGAQVASAARFGAVHWNALGTPSSIGTTNTLATGLSSDPATAARQFLAANPDVFGLDEQAVAALDLLSIAPIGTGAAVLLRQRFGGLPRAPTGWPRSWSRTEACSG
jgi:hypothetical protein